MGRLFLVPTVAAAVLMQACGAASGRHAESTSGIEVAQERFEDALTYEEFVASDTVQADIWHTNYDQAEPAVIEFDSRLRTVAGSWRMLVVAESSCRDSYESVPHLARLADRTANLELRLLRRDEAGDLLAAFPLDGRAAVPLVLLLDSDSRVRGVWIEQPAELRDLIATQRPRLCDEDLGKRVREWRDRDGGRSTLDEVITLIEAAAG